MMKRSPDQGTEFAKMLVAEKEPLVDLNQVGCMCEKDISQKKHMCMYIHRIVSVKFEKRDNMKLKTLLSEVFRINLLNDGSKMNTEAVKTDSLGLSDGHFTFARSTYVHVEITDD